MRVRGGSARLARRDDIPAGGRAPPDRACI